jgi:drug/metabolite transporter (DMT)-like permease
VVTFCILLLSSVVFFSWMIFNSDPAAIMNMPSDGKAAIVFLGVFCLAIAFWFWQEGVSRLGASRAGFFLYLEPLSTTALAVPYLNEPFGPYAIAGAIAVMLGVVLAERKVRRPAQ